MTTPEQNTAAPAPPTPRPGGHQLPVPAGWQHAPKGVMRERVRTYIEEYRRFHGRPPSYRLIGEALAISVGTVSYHVVNLRERGAIGPMLPPPVHLAIGPRAAARRRRVLADIAGERRRQDVIWGDQRHPMLPPELAEMRPGAERVFALAEALRVATAQEARAACQTAHLTGQDSFARIALEEVCEWLEAVAWGDPAKGRVEAVQVAAVFAKIIERYDAEEVERANAAATTA